MAGHYVDGEGEEKRYSTFLVTNKHVLNGKDNIIVRFGNSDHSGVLDYPVQLQDANGAIWIGHPAPDIDVAAISINAHVLRRDTAAFEFFSLDKNAVGIAEMRSMGVSEGDGVFVLGFPMGIVAEQTMFVIARAGCIARVRDVLNSHASAFLIDANIFPGNSGGPVVISPELASITGTQAIHRSALIGIVKSYVPYQDVAISKQTGNARVIFEENSGLALVETVDSIRTAVELCHRIRVAPQLAPTIDPAHSALPDANG
ncbi:serine protease [Lysobacter sp. CFH 32150]|uniref:S1 family peptidase n=1 Tax=Lysobacter sp. CFH 32150 TaxID=2927128 RepID=UPI001FA7101D|nr:serine protease [Lysobacter sp. CFH 32150]